MGVQRAGASSLRFERLPSLNSREQLREGDAQAISNPNDRRQAKILPSSLQVTEEGPMHLAIISERFLRCKASLNTDFTNALSESFQDIVHATSVCEWLPDRLQMLR